MSVAAILTAAGSGSRLGHAIPKAFVPVGGVPLLLRAAEGLLRAGRGDSSADLRLTQLVVTVPAGMVEQAGMLLAGLTAEVDLWVVEGGATRQASVAAGLAALNPDIAVVLVHDAARAFTPPQMIERVTAAVRAGHRAVIPGLPVVDTIKRVVTVVGEESRQVLHTVPRAELVAVQTPQGFVRDLLLQAHVYGAEHSDDETTAASDDAGLVEALGEPVWVVPGEESALKITTPADLVRVEQWLSV